MDVRGISLSGINVGVTQLDISAHNVANANTGGFRPLRADAEELQRGGARARMFRPSSRVGFTDGYGKQFSGTDLVREAVTQITASATVAVNLRALEVYDAIAEETLDVMR
ncbi:MAG: hypothetical protein GF333_00525 [Candidatus Omnitrophica bacterium]|nr:hypothetical protein [Candidatus Omnitrophota bacterium]